MYLKLKTTHSTIIMKLLKHKVYSHLENRKIPIITKNTKMPRFNIYRQLQIIVDSFSFDCFPQFKFPTKNWLYSNVSPGKSVIYQVFLLHQRSYLAFPLIGFNKVNG